MILGDEAKVRGRLVGRALAYNRVFDRQNQFTKQVLKDLAKFCRAHESTFLPDPRAHALLEGRREVFLRIVEHLQLSIEELYDLHKIREFPVRRANEKAPTG